MKSQIRNNMEEQQTNEQLQPRDLKQKQLGSPGRVNRFWVALIRTGVLIPTIATAITGIIYLADPPHTMQTSLMWGALVTITVWLALALFCRTLVTANKVNPRSFGLLQAKLALYQPYCEGSELKDGPVCAARQSYRHFQDYLQTADNLLWVLATGYITLWEVMHHIQEAFMEFGPKEAIVGEAYHDRLCIINSTIPNSEILLQDQATAIKALDPSAGTFFTECHSSTGGAYHPERNPSSVNNHLLLTPVQDKSQASSVSVTPEEARSILRRIRGVLNRFVDDRWEGLVHTRNLLLATITITGIVVYLVLIIAIVNKAPVPPMVAGIIFYIVGAIAGLFGWLYKEAKIDITDDDYGLSLARLVATPLLSGLAGIGGVLITVISYTSVMPPEKPPHSPASFEALFTLPPSYLIPAALFGLTPALLFNTLLQQSRKYMEDLNSVKPSS